MWAAEAMLTIARIFFTVCSVAMALATTGGTVSAQTAEPARITVDLITSHSNLSAGLPSGEAVNLRVAADLPWGDAVLAELLDERKFGQRGGVAAASYTRRLDADWYAIGSLALGHGGLNWARRRVDLQLSRKWLDRQQLVASAALYDARFDMGRSDQGGRVAATWYAELPLLVEAGVLINVSRPGSVRSRMRYLSAVFGHEGSEVFTVRVSSGREAYQALGAGATLVDFPSRTVGATWRHWLGPDWGVSAQVEQYHNPSYDRRTLGLGVFARW